MTSMIEELTEIARHYHTSVAQAEEYLTGRGINGVMAQHHLLGVVADPVQGHEQYRGRLAIPYLTPAGVVDIRFRAIGDAQPKYLSMPGHQPRLYNAIAAAGASSVVGITEGELDAVVIQHHTKIPCVGLPGANAWVTKRHSRVFAGFERVLVFMDGDAPGRELGNKIARDVERARLIDMGDGMDATELLLAEGPEALQRKAGI